MADERWQDCTQTALFFQTGHELSGCEGSKATFREHRSSDAPPINEVNLVVTTVHIIRTTGLLAKDITVGHLSHPVLLNSDNALARNQCASPLPDKQGGVLGSGGATMCWHPDI